MEPLFGRHKYNPETGAFEYVPDDRDWRPRVMPDNTEFRIAAAIATDDVKVPSADLVSNDVRENDIALLARILRRRFGDNVWDDSPEETSRRVVKYWDEMGVNKDDPAFVPGETALPFDFTVFPASAKQMIVVPCIEFASLCAHHLMPFYGLVHLGYISHKLQVGLSKIPRLVDFWAQRPQVQEQLGAVLARDFKARLDPMGVMVVVQATHTCMSCRGVKKYNGAMITSLPEGTFLTNPHAREEFMSLVGLCVNGGSRS